MKYFLNFLGFLVLCFADIIFFENACKMNIFCKHDRVDLSIGVHKFVATGTVVKVKPNDIHQGETLGDDRIAILVDDVFVGENHILPYPSKHATKLVDAKDIVVLWDRARAFVCTESDPQSHTVSPTTTQEQLHANYVIADSQGDVDTNFIGASEGDDEFRSNFEDENPLHQNMPIGQVLHSASTWTERSILCPTTDAGVDGDEVYLLRGGRKVGYGVVHHVEVTKTCHSIQIGIGNISLRIIKVYEGHHNDPLPFPHAGADTLSESIGGLVRWPKSDVCKVGEAIANLCQTSHEQHTGANENCERNDPICEKGKHHVTEDDHVDYTQRRCWNMKEVELYFEDRLTLLAIGIISVPLAIDVVNNKVLGDKQVGVTLMHIHRSDYFPDVAHGDLPLVAWSIDCVKLKNDGRFLGDIMKEAQDDSDDSLQVIPEPAKKVKRAYHSVKRTKMDPAERLLKQKSMKKNKRLDDGDITASRSVECCSSKCCQNTTIEDFKAIRSEYWGQSFENRKTFLLGLFHNRSQDMILKHKMLLKARLVCKKGFYNIYGISKSGFYQMENAYIEGQKVGFHGNEGQFKSRKNTMVAKALLENILRATGEPMPHLAYNGGKGTDDILYKLPSSMTMASVWQELKMAMKAQDLDEILYSTLTTIWHNSYANYDFHTTSAFSKCDLCSTLKEGLHSERRFKERAELERKRAEHLQEQMSRRQIYYSWRIRSKQEPHNYLCIIHDKMDQKKTWLPRVANIPKSLAGKHNPLPISLTGMITHGRDPGAYAHYGLTGLWASDPDFTITSITKCLRDLEEYRGDKSGHLGNVDVQEGCHTIFRQLLDQNAFEAAYLTPKNLTVKKFRGVEDGTKNVVFSSTDSNPRQARNDSSSSSSQSFKPLPKHLVLQMDNSAKDNKNQTMMAYCSNLVARGVFETVTMSFLMVGHTHEDIDAAFSKVSLRTKGKDIGTLPELMAEVWECMSELHMVPSLITEVVAYKSYLKQYKVKSIMGQSKPISFRFSMIENKPVYQYKQDIHLPWIPPNGRELWAKDPISRELMVPIGEPHAKKMFKTYENKDDVVPYIRKYIEHHESNCSDESSEAYRIKTPLIQYWKSVADTLEREFGFDDDPEVDSEDYTSMPKLSYQFWPRTNHGTGYFIDQQPQSMDADATEDVFEQDIQFAALVEEREEDARVQNEMFVGRVNERIKPAWNPLQDIKVDSFVILNPSKEWEEEHNIEGKFWIVRAQSEVLPNISLGEGEEQEYAPCFYGEWWRPKKRGDISEARRYAKIFTPNQYWERDPGFENNFEWHKAQPSMYSFVHKGKPENLDKKGVTVGTKVLDAVREHIARLKNT